MTINIFPLNYKHELRRLLSSEAGVVLYHRSGCASAFGLTADLQ